MRRLDFSSSCKTTKSTTSSSASSASARASITPAAVPPVRGTRRISTTTVSTKPPRQSVDGSHSKRSSTTTITTTTTTSKTSATTAAAASNNRQWRSSTLARTKPPPQPPPPPQRQRQPVLLSRHHSAFRPPTTHRGGSTTTFTGTTTVATAGASRAPSRPQHHKQYVASVTIKTHSSRPSVSNMPVGDRPRQPQLSAAAARSINRTPLTPKIAAKGPPVTPLTRRPQSSTPVLANNPAIRDDVSSPVNAFLANITPRSGQRQTRVDSANSTPTITPNNERASDHWESNNPSRLGLATSPLANDIPRQTVSQIDLTTDSNDSSKFFYASDAKSNQPGPPQRPASVPQKGPNTFFYANGTTVEGRRDISPPSNSATNPLPSPNLESATTKFFFANGAPDMSLRPSLVPSGSGSAVSCNSRMGPSRPLRSNSNTGPVGPAQRPASPIKSASILTAQTLRNTTTSPTSPKRNSLVSSPPTSQQQTSSVSQQRVSIDATPREMGGHKRTGSAATKEPLTFARFATSPGPSETTSQSPPLSPGLSKPAMTMASILQAAEDLREDDESRDGDVQSEIHSPTKSSHINDSVNELVANARRERKVQDLEITNASLEAINRTLERQLRKQTAELRRYRRLSRSGALSAASSRVTSLALTEPPTDMSDVAEEDETGFEEDEDMDSMYDSDLSSDASMNTEDILLPGAKIEARRRRDEKRLHLDLTKHQELLIDSQKMNQSLKRCLDFTETLIKEGQKALNYHVRVSDIKLGGRVLAPSDEEEDAVSFQEKDTTIRTDDPGLEPPWPKSSQDRDSGIELPPEGT
ncbi:hypothetical protein QQS21_011825 [Conoideocrella luteorostrata]|uniref:Uncharacterized protein n=1 Tax=Conoideocrella luteorostrata TaxID=1105319 RepID=A0AAJ0CDF0_9HYPO|nr:hypothetical protein QQS21_011825 [Conoideocrella luteorostrata]